jgi:hypothetical protein
VAGPEWIDDAGRCARDRLRASESEAVIGHCDWLAGNLRWSGDELLVVHDWDSMTADSEAVLVGFAAALYSRPASACVVPAPARRGGKRLLTWPGSMSQPRARSANWRKIWGCSGM